MNDTDKQEMEREIDNPYLSALREQSYALITIKPRKPRQQGRIEQAHRRIAERKPKEGLER
jgi:hypothetical protein